MAHQCVIIMLSLPLNVSCFPPIPAILASRDCANVNVTLGRPSLISISSSKIEVRKLGGFAMRLQRSRFNVQRLKPNERWEWIRPRCLLILTRRIERSGPFSHVTISLYIYGPHAVTNSPLLLSNHHHLHVPLNQTHSPSSTS